MYVSLLCALSILFLLPSSSAPPSKFDYVSLLGDAFLNYNSISLTRDRNCTSPLHPPPTYFSGVGRAFYANPVRFLDPSSNATASFTCSLSFTITHTPYCPFGDGLAFLVTSNTSSFSLYDGYMGLPAESQPSPDSSYFAVEFDTSFDPNLEDINGNHIGIDVNRVRSSASVDVLSTAEVNLKDDREISSWIEYRAPEKTIRVWVGYSPQIKPSIPVLEAKIDLSNQFREFMHVGFTASNLKGSSVHTINRWQFKTFLGSIPPAISMDAIGAWDTVIEIGSDDDNQPNPRVLELGLIFAGFAALTFLIGATLVGCVCLIKKRNRHRRVCTSVRSGQRRNQHRFQGRKMVPVMLSLNEIKSATNGFNQENIIGEGSSAVVYEGTIPNCGAVAVKRFNNENQADPSFSSIPFNTEFATMAGCLRHKNLVQLQGWCCEGNELVLVYEYMANGSLEKVLHSPNDYSRLLIWERRLKIIHGVASAIIYLHEECESQVIHRDIKTCNILLDDDFNAKLGDFGLAEVYRRSFKTRDVSATFPAGTMGYLAPEYAYSGIPSVKADVYSFGVVVLEIATGRRPVDEDGVVLADYVWDLREKGMLVQAADPRLMERFDRAEMERVLIVGLCCAQPNCEKRPRMREAERMLKGEWGLPALPMRKPVVRIQSVLPEGCEEIMTSLCGEDGDETQWCTPRTHFSKNMG